MAAPSSPSVYKLKLLIIYLSFYTTFIYLSPTYYASADDNVDVVATPPTRIYTRLIHRDSIHSPYYNPNRTAEDRAERDLKRSMIRFGYIQAKIQNTNDYRADLVTLDIGAGFFANISIGDPPAPHLVVMDTGSSLLWIQCQPCVQCFTQSSPIFDPSKSSTYLNVSCSDFYYCAGSTRTSCEEFDSCKYYISYGDHSNTKGNLATDKLTLTTSDEGIITVPDIVFGCGHINNMHVKDDRIDGILGLGPEPESLVSQLGLQFSYCIGNISDPHYDDNNLILGEGAKIEGASSPLEIYRSFYYVALEGISVGTKQLEINPTVFQRKPSDEGGVIIDSGSTYTYLAKDAYEPLSNEVQNLLPKLQRTSDPQNPSSLCYIGQIYRDLQGFPTVTFHFSGGAELVLGIDSFFREINPTIFCMAVMPPFIGLDMTMSVIGVMAQQYYNVGYDLRGNKISFLNIDCNQLET